MLSRSRKRLNERNKRPRSTETRAMDTLAPHDLSVACGPLQHRAAKQLLFALVGLTTMYTLLAMYSQN